MGVKQHLEQLTIDFCKADFKARYQAHDAILALAGNIEFDQVKSKVEQHFGNWDGRPTDSVRLTPPPGPYHFDHHESEQTQIGIAYPSVDETHADYYAARMAVECLSGGMSGRLFTEVREKRGLCYTVGAHYSSFKGIGSIMGYAGTRNDRAQETLDCFIA